ncbi:hypothetical protein COLO4_11963 [Corchorus olitorius]|uniref:Uncharacterized protein n=1 Tax=Corchorus olitorius TaxID=93759 RepID=A0A1R3K2W7_9ROSI|nr:hypothetical protein COLO4_11963 [Corchorus olitorius]
MREALEGRKKSFAHMSRIGRVIKCGLCKQAGHNKKRCLRVPKSQQPGKETEYTIVRHVGNVRKYTSIKKLKEAANRHFKLWVKEIHLQATQLFLLPQLKRVGRQLDELF